jgi:flagellar hook-basal body complex protein FliE
MIRLLVGVAIGFVLGSAAGRGRYEKIKAAATDVVNKPQVQDALKKVDDVISDKAPVLHDVADAAAEATS